MSVSIIPVTAEKARIVWPLAEPHVAKALVHYHGAYWPEDVLDLVEKGRAQLWLVQKHDKVIAALVSWINYYPRRTTICVPLIGGEQMKSWFRLALLAIESWAMEVGCDALEGGARRGWARLAKMEETAVALWKDFPMKKQEAA